MNWIQLLLIVSVLALLVYLLRSRSNGRSKAWVKVGYVLFVIAGTYAILRPDDTIVIANWLGVDRGTDLLAAAAEELHGPGHAIGERRLRPPTQHRPGTADIQLRAP